MAKSVLDIIIKLSKQGGADKETVTGLIQLKSAIMNAAAVAGTLVAAGYAVKKVFDETVGTMVAYADQVRSVQQSTGLNAEESSRLIQVMDDLKVEYADLQKVIQKNGDAFDFSVKGLAKMSDEYKSLTSAQEKAEFMQKRFGKSWVSFVEVMEKGSGALLTMNDSVEANLILTDKAVAEARKYQVQVDNLSDAFMGLKIAAGEKALPAVNDLMTVMTDRMGKGFDWKNMIPPLALITVIRDLSKAHQENNPVIDSATSSYTAWAKSMEEAKTQTEDTTLAVKAQEEAAKAMSAANQEFLGTMGSIQSAEESYAGTVKSLADERIKIEQDRAAEIAKGWQTDVEKVAEYDTALANNSAQVQENELAHDLANKKIILGLLERKLTADGILDDTEMMWLLNKGVAWGVYSQTVITETQKAIAEANALTNAINGIPTGRTFTMTMNMNAAAAAAANFGGSGFSGNKRAGGGPVNAGEMYMVGENGPELFVSNQNGTIVPNGGGSNMGGVGSGSSIVVNLSMNSVLSMADRESMKRLTPFIIDGIREAQAQGVIK